MNIIDIITKKKNKYELSYEELKFTVDNYLNDNIKDYQMSSLLMAIALNDMSQDEIYNLTKVMIESGEILDLSSIDGIVVDKHSTGGVGDKTTLVVGPLVAACDVKVAKMSGRGLGITGGTIDKLESIEGFNTVISKEDFIKQVNAINIAIVSQTQNLVPADKKIYALRDVTGLAESIPLIASSIMSKKIASGADKIVLDIKVGEGALIKNLDDAKRLSQIMIDIGKKFNKEVVCILTDMSYPLGYTIGNALEVREAIETLKGNGEENFNKLCITLASYMVSKGKDIPIKEAEELVKEKLQNKEGLSKLCDLVKYQNGNISNIEIGKNKYKVLSKKEGYINNINVVDIAKYVNLLGAGRMTKEDSINHKVGIVLNKVIGDYVKKDDVLAYVVTDDDISYEQVSDMFIINQEESKKKDIIIDIMD